MFSSLDISVHVIQSVHDLFAIHRIYFFCIAQYALCVHLIFYGSLIETGQNRFLPEKIAPFKTCKGVNMLQLK